MKKILILLTQIILVSSFSFSVSACFDPLGGGNGNDNGEETKPPKPPPNDIDYYQKLIEKTKIYVNQCEQLIAQIKKDWNDGKMNEAAYQFLLDQVSVGLYNYQSEINEYQYQILILETKGNKFTLKQILQGLDIISNKLTTLEQALTLEKKYPDNYPESEVKKLKDDIKKAKEIKEMFEKLKEEEEEENKCGNLFYHTYQS